MSAITDILEDLDAINSELQFCEETLAADPDNAEILELKQVSLELKAATEARMAELQGAESQDVPPPPPPAPVEEEPKPKFDMSKHPKFLKTSPEAAAAAPVADPVIAPVVFNVGDVVQAKYAKDHQWYKAKIISKTGSSQNPTFIITFPEYNETQSNTHKESIRPLIDPRKQNLKRFADGTPAATPPATPASPMPLVNTTAVISKAPSVDPSLMVAKRVPSMVSDGPTREKPAKNKLKGQKTQEERKNNWQSFQANPNKKRGTIGSTSKTSKDSMFRTPDLPGAKGKMCFAFTVLWWT